MKHIFFSIAIAMGINSGIAAADELPIAQCYSTEDGTYLTATISSTDDPDRFNVQFDTDGEEGDNAPIEISALGAVQEDSIQLNWLQGSLYAEASEDTGVVTGYFHHNDESFEVECRVSPEEGR